MTRAKDIRNDLMTIGKSRPKNIKRIISTLIRRIPAEDIEEEAANLDI